METLESRFAHLLQPIRDLTKNWDIDVASELNDYLEELDEMCITFDGGQTRLNFAEAALLIQGSTCIYSKKVQLLHDLVYQTMEYINNRNDKNNKKAAAADSENGGADDNHGDARDDEPELTCITLEASKDTHQIDSTVLQVLSLLPESLISSETHEKQELPLISVKGEILYSQKDFRINMFHPGEADFFLLTHGSAPYVNVRDYEPQQQPQDRAVCGNEAAPLSGVSFGGGDAPEEDFLPLENSGMELDQQVEEHVERHQAPGEGRGVRERQQVEAEKSRKPEAPPAVNCWELHDLYANLGGDKPLQPGKCYKVPNGLEDRGKRKRKHQSALQEFTRWFKGIYDPPEHKLKNGPKCTDLNYIYLSTMKDKMKSRKRVNRRMGLIVSDEELRQTFLQPESAGAQLVEEPAQGFQHPDLDDTDDNHQDFPEDAPAEFDEGEELKSPDDGLSYEDLVRLRVEQLVATSNGYVQETALSRRVKEWEENIKPVLDLQEKRPAFDIHEYGNRIVSSLSEVGQRRLFSSLVSDLDNFEACKFLLASLQLANDYTVEIDSTGSLEESLDMMGLTLLSSQRATDRFKTMDLNIDTDQRSLV
ncbi:condensin-2 complex subunit H2 isoform X1 [Synchiropus splendidus]|uniref:condensin-2 complex subunit H2 isoform X1 n=1 Tax=Synchiropus splendidus TaxID=270530 RepID=UPI00237D52D1|nr:condensin-2 complex subunit H2 isoform X1 [Synchiropus splendidus]